MNFNALALGMPSEDVHAFTIGDIILVRDAHVNDVRVLREELIHTQQQKIGFSSDSVTPAEIEAREQMVSHASEWGLTAQEVQELQKEISTIKIRGKY